MSGREHVTRDQTAPSDVDLPTSRPHALSGNQARTASRPRAGRCERHTPRTPTNHTANRAAGAVYDRATALPARSQASFFGIRARGGRVRASLASLRPSSCRAATGTRDRRRGHVPVSGRRSTIRPVAMVRYAAGGRCLPASCAAARRRDPAVRGVFVGLRSPPRSLGTIDSGACDRCARCARRVWPTIVAESRRPAASGRCVAAHSPAAARGRDHGHPRRHAPGQRHPARR